MQKSFKTSELSMNKSGDDTFIFATNISNPHFGNTTYWFWVKNKDHPNDDDVGCSAVITCNLGM